MAQSYRSKALGVMRQADREIANIFDYLIGVIQTDVRKRADANGIVPISQLYELQQFAGEQTTRLFLARTNNNELKPFTVQADRTPYPLSHYSRILFRAAKSLQQNVVEQQAGIMRRKLSRHPDLIARLSNSSGFARELNLGLRPNPFIEYDPMHSWVDPSGYRLSDRIWRTSGQTRRKIDALLDDSIRKGESVDIISNKLTQFLTPGRSLTGRTPHGTTGSFDARRLAQTELTRAEASAAEIVAQLNPFIEGVSVVLSPSHPRYDICDEAAAASPFPKDAIPSDYQIPMHPLCVTPGQTVLTTAGPRQIENISAGDLVKTHTGAYMPVKVAWSTIHNGGVYKIITDDSTFEVTGNHPVLTDHGWVDAEYIELGDKIVNTSRASDCVNGVGITPEHHPALIIEPFVTDNVALFIVVVPSSSVSFDSNLYRWQSEVDEVASYSVFALIGDASTIESVNHFALNSGRISETFFSKGCQHRLQTRVIANSRPGDFFGNLRSLGRIVVTGEIEHLDSFIHGIPGLFPATSIILFPLHSDGGTSCPQWDVTVGKQISKHPILNPIYFSNIRGGELLNDIDFVNKISYGALMNGLKVEGFQFDNTDAVFNGMFFSELSKLITANGANHSNLLLLLPESGLGAESGNSVVDEIASPIQALGYYSAVRHISTRDYHGPVYNMEVMGDNSYTVNGAVVHNCMCSYSYVFYEENGPIVDELYQESERGNILTALAIDYILWLLWVGLLKREAGGSEDEQQVGGFI